MAPFLAMSMHRSTKRGTEEFWDTAGFRRINYVISALWDASFAWCAVFGLIGIIGLHDTDNFWTGWILQLRATFFAMAFGEVYPDDAARRLAPDADRKPADR
jgi:hypothetical protein